MKDLKKLLIFLLNGLCLLKHLMQRFSELMEFKKKNNLGKDGE